MARLTLAILILGCCTCAVWSVNYSLREVFGWRQMDFVFPDQKSKSEAIASGEYVQANNLPLGLEVWRDKLFITVPRWKSGVISTLNYVSLGPGLIQNHSPKLIPYPNYQMNRLPSQGHSIDQHIISTFRLSVDKCDRLWVIDMAMANGTKYGQPQLIVIDLNTDQVIRRFVVAADLLRSDGKSWFPGLLADVDRNSCDRAYAYLPDIGYGMVVYDFKHNSARRIEHDYFYFDPTATTFNVGGVRIKWRDGVFGLSLSKRHENGYRTLYFQVMASTRMFSVDTSVLQSNRSAEESFDEYHYLGYRPAGMQAGPMSSDQATDTVFYVLANQDAVGCWNPKHDGRLTNETSAVVAQDSETLEYPSDLKVDANSNLWVLSDRMPRFRFQFHQRFNLSDVNYRVFNVSVTQVVKGTNCAF